MGEMWFWDRLGIGPTEDRGAIRRTYARQLKAIDPEAEPAAFIELRAARDAALAFAAGCDAPFEPLWPQPSPPLPSRPGYELRPGPPAPPPPSLPEPAPEIAAPPPPPVPSPPEPIPAEPDSPPPDPGPMPAMVVARSALPELDVADLERVDSLLESAEPPSWAELEEATRRVLESPAAERIDIARWLEGWAAERIAAFTPRSDPMISPAVEHFRWDLEPDLNRPPIVDWIMQRRIDREFEIELSGLPGGYSRLIGELRKPISSSPGKLAAWWKGVRVEYLLAYLEALNPTVLAGLNGDTLDWWRDHIAAQADTRKSVRSFREWRRKAIWDAGITGARRGVSPLLILGILLMPYIFAWVLLQHGYGVVARTLAFGWLAFVVLAVLVAPPPGPELMYEGRSIEPHYLDMETDVAPITAWATGSALTLERIAGSEPGLFRILSQRWYEAAGAREDGARFRESIAEILRKAYCEAADSADSARICSSILARKAAGAASAAAPPATLYRGPPVIPAYQDMAQDVDPVLLWMTGGRVSVKDLEQERSGLAWRLRSAWTSAGQQGMLAGPFTEEIASTIDRYVKGSLADGPYEPLAKYWRLRADMAAFARSARDDEACESVLRGAGPDPVLFPPEIEARVKAFAAEAAFLHSWSNFTRFGERRPGMALSVPPAIAGRAAYYAHLTPDELGSAMLGRGTAAQRCDARIGLIEALLQAPPEKALPVMHQLATGY